MSQPTTTRTALVRAGKLKKRDIKQLKRGAGPVVDQSRAAAQSISPTAVPVLIVYEQRPKRRGLRALLKR